MKTVLSILLVLLSTPLLAQRSIRFEVRDARNGEPVSGATVTGKGIRGQASNDSGVVVLNELLNRQAVAVSAVGFQSFRYVVGDSSAAVVTIALQPEEKEEETVIVTSTRTESRIENLPTRVEVIGSEEVDEESGVKPGNIASLLGDVAGIQTQQASAVSGNAEMRVQGLPGKYTQLLRDGMPLFGAFAGNFSILQIPPLDLKQVEVIKGSSSTLYGGGAIAGMINLISRKPVAGVFERSVLLNQSSLGETNVNTYFSNRQSRFGYTLFAGYTRQRPQDTDGDGYTDVARNESVIAHPVLYFYPNAKSTLSLGYQGNWESREGGDLKALQGKGDAQHAFFINNRIGRQTADFQWEYRRSDDRRINVKAIASWFDRTVRTNTFTDPFQARQLSYYTEFSSFRRYRNHDLVSGINVLGQEFRSPGLRLPGESHNTYGFFIQDDWRLHPKLTLETGFRFDYNSSAQAFPLPRLSVLYRISPVWTARAGGGYGYRIPSAFNSDLDERDFPRLTGDRITAERSHGANADINFHKRLGDVNLSVNQSFFITSVSRVSDLGESIGGLRLFNWPEKEPLVTKGLETYVQLRVDELEAYLGYTFTDAQRRYFPAQPRQPLIARDKFAAVVSYEFSKNFRACIEASHIGRQYLEDGTRTPDYFLAAGMVRYDWRLFSFVLNCENLLDYRQNKVEKLISGGSSQSPVFRELWAPIDGRVVNLSVRIKW